ncbi:lysozyme [Orbus hercynius]|uniref:Lysozyme n=1 Tax=Orbus hercynius TaxID=593135 RepID=A0A495RHA5_9GAMM|nr:lysozyme [Orbus hercynius]RKS86907.1 lysozyme [Orbus hercynius]
MKNLSKIVTSSICSVGVIIGIVLTNYRDDISISRQGLEIIGNAESCRNEPYYCPANILTIGIGSTTGQIEQRIYSDDEIAVRWVSDIKQAEQCVNQYASGAKLPQSVFDATVSITFNVGCSKMKMSTMYRYLNTGDYQAACHELPRWNKSAGKVLNGLVIRREKERELCLSDLNLSQ